MLTAMQLMCVELLITGKKQVEIAKELSVSANTVSNWKKDPEFMDEFYKRIRETIRTAAGAALRTMTELLYTKSAMVRYMAAKDLLDRAGYKAPEEADIMGDVEIKIEVDYGENS